MRRFPGAIVPGWGVNTVADSRGSGTRHLAAPARAQLAAVLARWGGRPTLLAVAIVNLVAFMVLVPYINPANLGADAMTYRRCAVMLAQGAGFCGAPYPPLMAVAALPLSWVSPMAAAAIMSTIEIVVLGAGVTLETRGQARIDRLLVGVAVVTFTPVVYELLLGQTTLLIAAAIYPVARRSDTFRNGIPIGIVLAVAPKALLAPFLVWMLVWRRHAFLGALLTALALTCGAVLVLGLDPYREWLAVVTGSSRSSLIGTLSNRDMGNLSLWPLEPVTIAAALFVALATVMAILQDESHGFVAALFGGLLLAPYSMLYAYSVVLLAVRPALGFAPRATRALSLTVNFAHPALGSIVWTMAGLGAFLTSRVWEPADAGTAQSTHRVAPRRLPGRRGSRNPEAVEP